MDSKALTDVWSLSYGPNVEQYATLDDALVAAKSLAVDWYISDPQGQIVFDWMDRIGP